MASFMVYLRLGIHLALDAVGICNGLLGVVHSVDAIVQKDKKNYFMLRTHGQSFFNVYTPLSQRIGTRIERLHISIDISRGVSRTNI